MNRRIQKKDVVAKVAKRMAIGERKAEQHVDVVLDVLCKTIKSGDSITLPGFGGFYVKPKRPTWVFKFNPGQKLRAVFGWSSTYKGKDIDELRETNP